MKGLMITLALLSAWAFSLATAALTPLSAISSTTITFTKDMKVVTSGNFSEVDSIIVNYDFARILPLCKATATTPNVTITAFYRIFGSVYAAALLDTRYQINKTQITLTPFEAPGPLSFWFSCTKNGSAPVYDSDYGKNYNFNLNGAVINFEPDFTNPITGTLKPSEPILVRYSVVRGAKICPTNDSDPTLSVMGFYQTNGGPVQSWTVYSAYLEPGSSHFISSYFEGVIYSAAGKLTLWFSCQSHQASGWDSNMARNYVFTL